MDAKRRSEGVVDPVAVTSALSEELEKFRKEIAEGTALARAVAAEADKAKFMDEAGFHFAKSCELAEQALTAEEALRTAEAVNAELRGALERFADVSGEGDVDFGDEESEWIRRTNGESSQSRAELAERLLARALDFIESLCRDPLLDGDDHLMELEDVVESAKIEAASIRKAASGEAAASEGH